MIKIALQSTIYLLMMTLLTGIIYPATVAGLGQLLWPYQSMGSLIKEKDHIVGSELLAQKFSALHYFWPRPSASDYNTIPAYGSNLGPTSATLKGHVEERRKQLALAHNTPANEVPEALLSSSGSGIDPMLSIEAINYQKARVAKARNLKDDAKLSDIIQALKNKSIIAFNDGQHINVLLLNLSLDKAFGKIP